MLSTLLVICPLVFLAGVIDSIAGGGGLITLPAYLAVGLPPHAATATNKCSSTFGTFVATARFLKNGKVNVRSAIAAAVFALIGSWMGAKLNLILDEKFLYYVLLIALPIIGIIIIFKPDIGVEEKIDKLSPAALVAVSGTVGFVMGVYDGFFGPGTGTFALILFTTVCGFDILTANGNTKVLNLCSNIAAFITFAVNGEIIWAIGLPAALFGIAGNYLGAGLAMKNGIKIIRPMFIVVFVLLLIRCISTIFF